MFNDTTETDGVKKVDTNCLFLTRPAFGLLPLWAMMPKQLGAVGDSVFWDTIVLQKLLCAHHGQPTVAFRTQYQVHYQRLGETPPPHTKSNAQSTIQAAAWWETLSEAERQRWRRYFMNQLL